MEIVYKTDKAEYELILRVNDQEATVGDLLNVLAPQFDGSRPKGIDLEGHFVPAETRLHESGMFVGGVISACTGPTPSPPSSSQFALKVVGGLNAGAWYPLRPGKNAIGRHEGCAVVLADISVSRQHAFISLSEHGIATISSVSERSATIVDGMPVEEGTPVLLEPNASLQIGSVYLELVAPQGTPAPRPAAERFITARGTIPFNRPPRLVDARAPSQLEVPTAPIEQEPPALNILPMLAGAAAPVVMTLTIPNAPKAYLLLALLSPVVGVASWYQLKRKHAKKTRSAKANYQEELTALRVGLEETAYREVASRRRQAPDLAELSKRASQGQASLWERRPEHEDFLELAVGFGDIVWQPPLDGPRGPSTLSAEVKDIVASQRMLHGVPFPINLSKGGVIGLYGPRPAALAVARGLVCQSAVLHGPADLSMAVIADPERALDWEWAKWLPQTMNPQTMNTAGGIEFRRLLAATPPEIDAIVKLITETSDREDRKTFLVVDNQSLARARDAQAQKLRAALRGEVGNVTGVVLADTRERLLGACSAVVRIDESSVSMESLDSEDASAPSRPWGTSAHMARAIARALARYEDIDMPESGGGVPDDVGVISLLSLDDFDPATVHERWEAYRRRWRDQLERALRRGADPTKLDPEIRAKIGMSAEGPFEIDLLRGRHGVIGGMTGSGKSELLNSIILGLALAVPPEQITFGLFDFKGGASFASFEPLPHTVGILSDLDVSQATRALRCLQAELRRRKELFARAGVNDIKSYQLQAFASQDRGEPIDPLPYLLVLIDEFAAMKEVPGVFEALDLVASQGRSLGVHMLLATQSPSGVVSETIRKNSDLWICLRVKEEEDSKTLIGIPDASSISRPGRAYVKLGTAVPVLVQSAFTAGQTRGEQVKPIEIRAFRSGESADVAVIGDEEDEYAPEFERDSAAQRTDLDRMVAMAAAAFADEGGSAPRRPFPDPLGTVTITELINESTSRAASPDASRLEIDFALADDPDNQDQYPVAWNLRQGNLVFFGATGSGTTTSLATVALSALIGAAQGVERHLYVIDFGVGDLEPLCELQGSVGAVLGATERERQIRLIRILNKELARRKSLGRAGAQDEAQWIVLVDNFGAFRAEYDDVPGYELLEQFYRVFAEGPDAGIYTCMTCDRMGALPGQQAAVVQQRVVLQLADGNEYAQAGVPRDVPNSLASAGRGWLIDRQLLVQVAHPGGPLRDIVNQMLASRDEPLRRARGVGVLSDRVDAAQILSAGRREGDDWYLPVGTGDRDLETAFLNLLDGEHAFISGPVRSGKSTTLSTVARVVREFVPEVFTVGLARRASCFTACPDVNQMCMDEAEILSACESIKTHSGPVLVLVDDSERLSDPVGDALTSILALRRADLHVVASGRPEFMRGLFNHWSQVVRKSKVGVLLRPNVDADGDLLGVSLPRRGPSHFPPGRGYLVDNGEIELIQVAIVDQKAGV